MKNQPSSPPVNLISLQQRFLDYLVLAQTDVGIDDLFVAAPLVDSRPRQAIYANAYRLRLKAAIENDHPILGLYLGDQLFAQLVDGYLRDYPSQCRSLRHFCQYLPQFLAECPPFSEHPILAELAQFERLMLDAFDAADAEQSRWQDLQAVPSENWPNLRFVLHPSVRILSVNWNSISSWQALKSEQAPPVAQAVINQEHWIIWRNRERITQFQPLDAGQLILINGFAQGERLSVILEKLMDWQEQSMLASWLVKQLQAYLDLGMIETWYALNSGQ